MLGVPEGPGEWVILMGVIGMVTMMIGPPTKTTAGTPAVATAVTAAAVKAHH